MQVLTRGNYSGQVTNISSGWQVIASITAYDSYNFNGEMHCHDNAHFSFTVSGGCVERKKNDYELTPGSIIYYSAGETHQVVKMPLETKRVNLEIEKSFFYDNEFTEQEAKLAISKNPDAKFLMVKIYHELITNDRFSYASIQMLLLRLIADSKRSIDEKKMPPWVLLLRTYLHDNTDEAISLTELANLTGIHPVTLSKQFPKYFNCTLGEYKRKLKIAQSLSKIKTPGITLTDIAYECGFFDQIHFTRNFKSLNGILPKDFRKL